MGEVRQTRNRQGAAPKPNRSAVATALAEAVERHRAGRLDEAIALYRQILAATPAEPDALHLCGMALHQAGRHAEAIPVIEAAMAAAPRTAAFAVTLAAARLALGETSAAAQACRRALALDPANAEAWNILGNALITAERATAAVEAYRQAVRLRPDYAEAHNNRGSALRSQGEHEAAAASLETALTLRPDYAAALANLGLVRQEQGRFDEALALYDRALALDAGLPAAHGNRGMLLLLLGRLAEGFAEYEWRWRMPGFSTRKREFGIPEWTGDAVNGRTILVHAEQGLGSQIQFVRFVEPLVARGARVALEAPKPLLRLFRESLARLGGEVAWVFEKGATPPACDRHVPLLSLPHRLGEPITPIPGAMPYLVGDAVRVERWRERLSDQPRPRVGLVWRGNPRHENDRNRSIPVHLLAPWVDRTDLRFVSLQVGPSAAADHARLPAGAILDPTALLGDFAETAALIETLDLVVSVDTAVAHLAGALGRPVWLLLPWIPDWRWQLGRTDSPWYPSLRLFRQERPNDWEGVLRRVTAALAGIAG